MVGSAVVQNIFRREAVAVWFTFLPTFGGAAALSRLLFGLLRFGRFAFGTALIRLRGRRLRFHSLGAARGFRHGRFGLRLGSRFIVFYLLRARRGRKEGTRLSVRLELQADYLAGVWANHENERWKSLQDGDLEEAINAASQVGDDRLQKASRRTISVSACAPGASAQRMRWLKRGYQSGKLRGGDTFSVPYDEL